MGVHQNRQEVLMPDRRHSSTQQPSMTMRFDPGPFREVRSSVGCLRPETGGILLGSRDDYHVQKFVFDKTGSFSSAAYDPDVDFLNLVVKREWETNQLALLGFVHSHPRGFNRLSGDFGNGYGDVGYLRAIFAAIPALRQFLVPIVFSDHDGLPFEIFPFIAFRGHEADYVTASLEVAPRPWLNPEKLVEPGE